MTPNVTEPAINGMLIAVDGLPSGNRCTKSCVSDESLPIPRHEDEPPMCYEWTRPYNFNYKGLRVRPS